MKPRTLYRVTLMTGRTLEAFIEADSPHEAMQKAEHLYERYGAAVFCAQEESIIDSYAEENA